MNIIKNIEYYKMDLSYEMDSDDETVGYWTAFSNKKGGYWGEPATTIKDAVESCIKMNKLKIIK